MYSLDPIVLVLVGLPARGKTYISHKVFRYLSWLGYNVCFIDDIHKFDKNDYDIAIYDSTNTALLQRNNIRQKFLISNEKYKLLWIETIVDDKEKLDFFIKLM